MEAIFKEAAMEHNRVIINGLAGRFAKAMKEALEAPKVPNDLCEGIMKATIEAVEMLELSVALQNPDLKPNSEEAKELSKRAIKIIVGGMLNDLRRDQRQESPFGF